MDFEFNIPLSREDLLTSDGSNYMVRKVFDPSRIGDKLEDAVADYRSQGAEAILQHFDCFYSIISHFSRLNSEILESAWNLLVNNLKKHINSLPIILDPDGIDSNLKKAHLNTLKMEIYTLTQFMEKYESDSSKPIINTEKLAKSKTKKKPQRDWDWPEQREEVLTLLEQLLQLEIQRLWDPPLIEEEFINLVSNICYRLLENVAVVRNKEERDIIVKLLGHMIQKHNHQLSASLKLIQLLQHFEHLVSPLAQALETFVTDFGAKNLVCDIIREIGRMDSSELSRDTSGTRSFSQFIVETAERIPNVVLPNISLLMSHLDGESYAMRNGVLGVIGELVLKVLSGEDLEDNQRKLREQFLDRLEEHIHDVNTFVRSKVLQIWLHLCQEKAIPIPRQKNVVDLIIGRLSDKSSQVRKYAIQFLQECLVGNPFAAKLSLEQLETSLEKESAKLKEMTAVIDASPKAAAAGGLEAWLAIEAEVSAAVDAHLSSKTTATAAAAGDEQEADVEMGVDEEGDVVFDRLSEEVRSLLSAGSWEEAVAVLRRLLTTCPNHDALQVHVDLEDEEEEEESEPQTPNQEKQELESLSKKKNIYMELLKRIFCGVSTEADLTAEEMEVDIDMAATQAAQKEIAPEAEAPVLDPELAKQRVVVQYLNDCVNFARQMKRIIPILCQLLSSKNNTDVLETIEFFISAHEFGLSHHEEGIRRMSNLVWSRDPIVKNAVVAAFERLYIDVAADQPRNKALLIVNSLSKLLVDANLGELTSLEELVCELMKQQLIPASVVQLLWQRFSLKIERTSAVEQRAAILLLSMIASAERDIVKTNLDVLIEHGLADGSAGGFQLAQETCNAILKLGVKKKGVATGNSEPLRLPSEHILFERLEKLILEGLARLDDEAWTPFMEVALTIIYHLSESADQIGTRIVKGLVRTLFGDVATDIEAAVNATSNADVGDLEIFLPPAVSLQPLVVAPRLVARVLSAAGHLAALQLYHLDVSVFNELKRRHRVQEEMKEMKDNKKGPKSTVRKTASARDSTVSTKGDTSASDAGLDEEMGVGGAQAEDAEAEYIRKICENEIVTGSNLLSAFVPVIQTICSNTMKYNNVELKSAAALALAKFMLVSSDFCDANLQLLFTILEKSTLPSVRSNTIIVLGDLTFRFPNLIEPWTPHLYARLRDDSVEVRKTTVTILTHLILNDMVKVKGQISEMAVCLEDREEKIANSAKLFFAELARKGNALYNIAPDVISRLSDPDTGIEEKLFRNIMKYLLQFIQKDKQAESLVEKLCHRFRATRTERQWRDLAYCLSLLPYNEKAFRRLIENIRCFHDKLTEEDVYQSFLQIVNKSKKFAKIELKAVIEEFEQALNTYHTKGLDENAEFEDPAKALSQASTAPLKSKDTNKPDATAATGKSKKKTRVAKTKPWDEDSGDEENAMPPAADKTPMVPTRGKRKPATAKKNRKKITAPVTFSDGDDDEDFL